MKNNKPINYIIMLCISLLSFIIYSDSQKKYYIEKDKFSDWIQFNTNGLLVIIGAFATIIAVIITINNSSKEKDNEVINRINKLKLIINLELNFFITSFEKELKRYYDDEYNRIKGNIDELWKTHRLDNDIKYFETNKVYKLNEKFNDYFYELILLDDSPKLIEAIKIIEVKDIFIKNNYIEDDNLKDILNIFTSEEVIDLSNYINYGFKGSQHDVAGLDILKDKLDNFRDSYESFKNKANIRSKVINELFDYLQDSYDSN
ncbi:hypothetical protein [Clostridium chrysemydis]|uniref:hypothetical protein n=2 Tax=Clostridium TaxID=1485 RepID=UPI003F6681C2